jgi:hypothetical protein
LLAEPPVPIWLPTPHRAMGEIQRRIWEHFGAKRRQFYLAGFLIGALGGLLAVFHSEAGLKNVLLIPAGGALGTAAVSVLSFVETLQARAQGNPTLLRKALLVLMALVALLAAGVMVAAICAYLL